VLISHDAGWYRPGEPDGGEFRGYTTISDKSLPALKQKGNTDADIRQLMVANPANVFAIRVRKVLKSGMHINSKLRPAVHTRFE
jgi:phosphotriesterase-related protein